MITKLKRTLSLTLALVMAAGLLNLPALAAKMEDDELPAAPVLDAAPAAQRPVKVSDRGSAGRAAVSVDDENAVATLICANGSSVGVTSLADLASHLNDGACTVRLNADVDITTAADAPIILHDVTLDLNGFAVTTTIHRLITVKSGGKLTVTDSVGGGSITGTYAEPSNWVVYVENGQFVMTGGELVVNVTSTNIYNNGALYVERGEARILGGAIAATGFDAAGVAVKGGQVTIQNATLSAQGEGAACVALPSGSASASVTISDSALTAGEGAYCVYSATNGSASLRVNSGSFDGAFAAPAGTTTISGGSFTDESISAFLPEGVGVTTDANGVLTLAPADGSVAAINSRGFTSLQAAVDAAQDGDTIKLLSDLSITKQIDVTKSFSLDGSDGNGGCYKITSTARGFNVNGTTTNLDPVINISLKNVGIEAAVRCVNVAEARDTTVTLTLDNVNFLADSYAVAIQTQNNGGVTVDIKNSTIQGYSAVQTYSSDTAITVDSSTLIGYNVWTDESESSYAAIVVGGGSNSTLNLANSTVKTLATDTGWEKILNIQGSGTSNTTVTFDNCVFESWRGPDADIEYDNLFYGADSIGSGNTVVIDGLTYDFTADTGYVKLEDAVAAVNGTCYFSFDAAIAAAKALENPTITLLADVTTTKEYSLQAGTTLDGNGHTLTNATGRVLTATDADVKNLTIVADGDGYAIYTNQNTTLENCVFSGTTNWQPIYVNDDGAPGVVVKGCTFNTRRSMVIRSDTQFTGNTLNGDKGLTIDSAVDGTVVTGNIFNNARLDVYPIDNAKITISKNQFLGTSYIELENKTYAEPVDLSGNYWENGVPADLPKDAAVNSYYTDAAMDGLFTVRATVNRGGAVTRFASLQAAIDAAVTGDTITVSDLSNDAETVTVPNTKAVLIEGANGVTDDAIQNLVSCQAIAFDGRFDGAKKATTFYIYGGLEEAVKAERIARDSGRGQGVAYFYLYHDVKLEQDIELPARDATTTSIWAIASNGGNMTVDLNGHTITQGANQSDAPDKTTDGAASFAAVISYHGACNLIIKDSSEDKTGKIIGSSSALEVYPGNALQLEGGFITTKGNWYNVNDYNSFGSVVRIRGGEFNMLGGELAVPTGERVQMRSTIFADFNNATSRAINISGGKVQHVLPAAQPENNAPYTDDGLIGRNPSITAQITSTVSGGTFTTAAVVSYLSDGFALTPVEIDGATHYRVSARFTVTFLNGDEELESRTRLDGEAVGELPAAPTRSGYDFTGWMSEGELITAGTPVTRSFTAVAQWERRATTSSASSGSSSSTPVVPEPPVEDLDDNDVPLADLPTATPTFVDVPAASWYHSVVLQAATAGYMKGTGASTFAPDASLDRGMMAQILHNLEKNPEAAVSAPFADVSGQYYTDAVAWGANNGILTGYDTGLYGGEDVVSREQVAVMFYRYAQLKGLDMSVRANALSGFTDAALISPWADNALTWAVSHGLMEGYGNGLMNPTATITRAEAAAILTRFQSLLG